MLTIGCSMPTDYSKDLTRVHNEDHQVPAACSDDQYYHPPIHRQYVTQPQSPGCVKHEVLSPPSATQVTMKALHAAKRKEQAAAPLRER